MSVTSEQFFSWLKAHGVDPDGVLDVRFTPAGVRGGEREVMMQVTTYAREQKVVLRVEFGNEVPLALPQLTGSRPRFA